MSSEEENYGENLDDKNNNDNKSNNESYNLSSSEMNNSINDNKMDEEKRKHILYEILKKNKNQKIRYDKYRSSSIEHPKKNKSASKLGCPRIKKIVQNVLGENVQISTLIQILIHTVAKLYAGELIEESKSLLVEEDKKTNPNLLGKKRVYEPIKPKHLREARRRMINRGILPNINNTNKNVI